jgi:hypothetical protein
LSDNPKEPIKIEYPGEKSWEQVSIDGKMTYAFYHPKSKVTEALEARAIEQGLQPEPYNPLSFSDSNLRTEEGICYVPLKKCPWPLASKPESPAETLWQDVRKFVYDHLDLPDERLYDVLTAWIFASWIPEKFTVVPYLFFHGPVASGKTRALEVLKSLCRRALMGCNISESAVFRVVEKWCPTVLLDETEIYSQEDRSAIQNLLNAGYRRGQYAIRVSNVEHGNPNLDMFEVFSFKALAGTEGFKNTLESRSIAVSMDKNVREVNFEVDEAQALKLRNQLLFWRWLTIFDTFDTFDAFQRGGVDALTAFTSGRTMELFACLVAVSNEGREAVLSFAKDLHEQKLEEEEASEEAEILKAVIEIRDLVEKGRFSTKNVKESFNASRDEREQWGSKSIGSIVKRLGFKQARTTTGGRGFNWDENRVKRLAMRYRLGYPPPDASNTSNASNSSNPSNDLSNLSSPANCPICSSPFLGNDYAEYHVGPDWIKVHVGKCQQIFEKKRKEVVENG